MERAVDRRGMASLCAGHLATDLAQGSLPALLVFLVPKLDLSYLLAGAVVLVATISSSIVQPLFGLWSDRSGAQWLLPGGVALAGVGIGLASVAPSYTVLLLCVLVSGLGVAAFHPEGSKFASYVSGTRRASGMALFSVGGNLGFAIGPVLASSLVLALGVGGGLLLVVPGLAIGALLLAEAGHLRRFVPVRRRGFVDTATGDRMKAFVLVQVLVALRSVPHFGLFTFVPLLQIERGSSDGAATWLVALFLFTGAIGTLVCGPLADRFGRKPIVIATYTLSAPLIVAYVLAGGILGDVALALAGATVIGTFGVTTVMSQEFLPSRIGLASGLSIGFAIGLGGVAATLLGGIADAIDLEVAVLVTASAPVLGALLALGLPRAPRVVVREAAASTT